MKDIILADMIRYNIMQLNSLIGKAALVGISVTLRPINVTSIADKVPERLRYDVCCYKEI